MATNLALPPRLDLNPGARRPTGDEDALLKKLDALYEEGRRFRDDKCPPKDSDQDLRLYRGELGPKKGDALFAANWTQAFIDRMVAQLTDNRPIVHVENRKAGLRDIARVAEKFVVAVWVEENMQRQTFKMCHNAA